jgi:hypothetical protein
MPDKYRSDRRPAVPGFSAVRIPWDVAAHVTSDSRSRREAARPSGTGLGQTLTPVARVVGRAGFEPA